MGIDFKWARREIESDWLSVCIVGMLFLGCCESAVRLFNSEIITDVIKYLYYLREDRICWLCVCGTEGEIGGLCLELCIEKSFSAMSSCLHY